MEPAKAAPVAMKHITGDNDEVHTVGDSNINGIIDGTAFRVSYNGEGRSMRVIATVLSFLA